MASSPWQRRCPSAKRSLPPAQGNENETGGGSPALTSTSAVLVAVPAVTAALLAFAAASARWTDAPTPAPGTPLVRIVQPDISQNERGEEDGERVLAALSKLSGKPGPVPRLVVWPEGVVRDFIESGYPPYIYDGASPLFTRWRLARLLGPRDLLLTGGTARLRIFSWLGMAFSGANVLGPVTAGFLIDLGGFAAAYGVLLAMPLVSVWVMRRIAPQRPAHASAQRPAGAGRWELLATPGLKVVYGTDAVAGAHGRNAQDLVCRVQTVGQPARDAIVSATSLSAEALGLGRQIGAIAAGQRGYFGDDREENGVKYSNHGTSEAVMRNQFKAWSTYMQGA